MSLEFLGTALLAISLVTSLIVEGIKKILESCNKKFSSNLLAIIVSTLVAVISSVVYIVIQQIPFSFFLVIEVLVLVLLSFLAATVGYDKVMQLLKQFMSQKEDDSDDKADE